MLIELTKYLKFFNFHEAKKKLRDTKRQHGSPGKKETTLGT